MECRARMCLPVRAWHGVYPEHLRDPISDVLAVACRIDAQRDVHVGGRGVGLAVRAGVLRLFKSHVVIRVRADKLSRLPQSIEHGEVDSRRRDQLLYRLENNGVMRCGGRKLQAEKKRHAMGRGT